MRGLCLSGGGIKAAAHIGALKAFEENKITFDCISGTSSGSIIATLYSLGYSSDEMLKFFKKYSTKIKYIEPLNLLKGVFSLIFKGELSIYGLNSGKIIEKLVNQICLERNIKNIVDIDMPLLIPTVNLQTGGVYVASSKEIRKTYSDDIIYINDISVGKAVRASCSYPFIFFPCWYNGYQLVDGGIRENLPWKQLKHFGADEVIGIKFETTLCNEDIFDNIIDISARSLDLVCHELSVYELEGIDYVIKIPFPKISLLDTKQIDSLYEVGYKFTKKHLKNFL